jgi:hypothetical protein
MGLDQYLYISNYIYFRHSSEVKEEIDSSERYHTICKAIGIPLPYPLRGGLTVEAQVGYWRKANAIHKWMVDNVQGGVDDCAKYPISLDELKELSNLCSSILEETNKRKQIELAKNKLSPTSGFFFGGTEIDEGYLLDLKDTIKIVNYAKSIDVARCDFECCGFYYQSSW